MIEQPGENMYYNSGASHLLSAIVQKATGTELTTFAEVHLFHPLGIQDYDWYKDSKGIVIGGFGLSLKAEDMLKIGTMMLQRGKWKNKRIVSERWVKQSTAYSYPTPYGFGNYGYHWWVIDDEQFPTTFFAMGYGGQYIIVVPEYEVVTTFTCDNYADAGRPLQYFKNEIFPVLIDKSS